jgi:hypothetical protein
MRSVGPRGSREVLLQACSRVGVSCAEPHERDVDNFASTVAAALLKRGP